MANATEKPKTDKGEKPKRKAKPRPKLALWGDRDEKGELKTKIVGKDVPGFDRKVHQPLGRKDFENPSDWLELRADSLESKAKKLRTQATAERDLGTVEQRRTARKMRTYFEKFEAMKAEMEASGFDTAKLLAKE